MDKKQRFDFQWIGRCQYDTHDKIWGWFFYYQSESDKKYKTKCYVVWGRTGKTPSFKTHEYDKWAIKRLVSEKQAKEYKPIQINELIDLWPTFYDDIENRFVLHILKESF